MQVYLKGSPMPVLRQKFQDLPGSGRAYLTTSLGTRADQFAGYPGGRETWREVRPDWHGGV